jgi:transposase InsO family protein
MRLQALKARPRRRRLPPDLDERQIAAVAANVFDRSFEAPTPNRKWIADFTYVWTEDGCLYLSPVEFETKGRIRLGECQPNGVQAIDSSALNEQVSTDFG